MGISEAVQWWEESQLRVLVLASLILQYFLAIASILRKRRVPPWFRFFTWLAYLGSDAIAIYALATLFNRYKKDEWMSMDRSSAGLEVVWAPILLMHLGGQDGITAYNIEDNELWRRHVLTSVSQVAVAIYVFWKSWSGDKRLLQASILIFVPGILKCFEKPWALKNASITSLTSSTSSGKRKAKINSLDKYVQDAAKYCRAGLDDHPREVDDKPYKLFVDIAYPYDDRLENLKYMVHNPDRAHDHVQSGLSSTFDRLYTKEQISKGKGDFPLSCQCTKRVLCGVLVRNVVGFLSFAAIGLFHKSHKEAYNDIDIKVTYTLLCCTASLEYLINKATTYMECFGFIFGKPWPDQVAQYNLIGYLARNRKHTKLETFLVCKDSLDYLWCMEPCKSSQEITKLVHGHVKQGWTNYIEDTASYSRFNDNRGQLTLQREECKEQLDWSIKRPFDETVLLWHLATDFCFYSTDRSTPPPERIRHCREISNYMVYLLFVNPEMLMTGTRRSLFKTAYDELKHMLNDEDKKLQLDGKKISQLVKEGKQSPGIICDSCKLSEDLMGLGKEGEEEKMWKVIEGVWVEMLCFSASRCRGYVHAKSLGKGGEYLSYVWLLLSYMGMETLAERLQRTGLPEEGDKGATTPAPTVTAAPATGDETV